VRELLAGDPGLAKQANEEGITPLWWLPDDEARAMEVVEALLLAGADPSSKNRDGLTAADSARRRGLVDVAFRLTEAMTSRPPASGIDAKQTEV
jgi:ankyrin repeat protein